MGEFADYALDESLDDYWDDNDWREDEAEHIYEYRRKAIRTFWYPGMRTK